MKFSEVVKFIINACNVIDPGLYLISIFSFLLTDGNKVAADHDQIRSKVRALESGRVASQN